ncbi:fungal-specific transcription factor domain-containing protein [Xylariaceae sp. FL0016]|nr:fungal-specific transcription factor domain-containing protein [Xylariaceae sp. FL0016]
MEDAMQDGRFVDVQCPREGLPSRTQTEEAFNTFFREISITVPILDYSQVRGILDNIYDQAASVSNAMLMILHLILAAESHVDSTSLKAADFFLKTVEEGTHESVQALVILALYYMNRDQRNVAWVIVGCAVRIARSLGMNLQERQDDEPLHYLERRKAIWWSVYMTDTFISCHLGRSSSIQDDGCFASAPSSSSWSANPWIPPGYDTESVALAVIENRILRKLYLERPSPKRYESTCTELLAAAQSWWSRLPDYLRPTCPTAPSYRRAIGHLGLRYYHSLMLITRRHLLEEIIYHSPSASRSERARICEQSNNDSIALAKTMAEQGLLGKFNYLDAFSIQSDGLILLVRVIKSPSAALAQEMVNLLPLLHLTEHLQSGRVAVKSYNAILAKLRPILIQEPRYHSPSSKRNRDQTDNHSLGQNVDINAPHVDPTPSLDFGPALQDLWTDGDFFGAEGVDIMTAFDMGTF